MNARARCAGKPGDAVMFVHGVGSTAAIWDYQLDSPLAERYRLCAVELRGNGAASDPPPETITRAGFAEDVLSVADAEHAKRFHFVGCSLGGVVGFELWKRAPERIASFTIVGSFAAYPNGAANAEGIRRAVMLAGTMKNFALERVAKLGLPQRRLAESVDQMACKSVESYLASTQATWTGDYREMLASVAVPTLVIFGEHDTIAPQALSQEIAGEIPGAQFEVVPGAGHVVNADAPEAFNALLQSFLERCTRSRDPHEQNRTT